MSDPQVIVLGGGPAGTATAIRCVQSGLRVALVERESFPRHRPGETQHPGILLLILSADAQRQEPHRPRRQCSPTRTFCHRGR